MASVSVKNEYQAAQVVLGAMRALTDWTAFFPILRKELVVVQDQHWASGFGRSLRPATVKARRKRYGYYGKFAKASGVGPGGPFMSWTGQLKKATQKFTKVTSLGATIDPDRNYSGPLRRLGVPAPFATFVDGVLGVDTVFDAQRLDDASDRATETWLDKVVVPKAIRAARRS